MRGNGLMKKATLNLKSLSELKTEMVNKAGIGRAGFENLEQRHKHIYIYEIDWLCNNRRQHPNPQVSFRNTTKQF